MPADIIKGDTSLSFPENHPPSPGFKALVLGTEVTDPIEHSSLTVGILKVIDKDGSEVFIPSFQANGNFETSLPLPSSPDFKLDDNQKLRLKSATDTNLPPILATHLALNTNIPLTDFSNYQRDIPPIIASIYGPPGVLKSKLLAILNVATGQEVYSFDSYSPRDLASYIEVLQELPQDAHLKEILSTIDQVKISKERQSFSLKETLDNFLEFIHKSPSLTSCLIDLPGYDPQKRTPDAIDFAALLSLNSVFLSINPQATEEQIISSYIGQANRFILLNSTTNSQIQNTVFINQVNKLD